MSLKKIMYFTGCPLGPGLPPLPLGPASPFQHKIIIFKILGIYNVKGEKSILINRNNCGTRHTISPLSPAVPTAPAGPATP